jgi:hypothetical protein
MQQVVRAIGAIIVQAPNTRRFLPGCCARRRHREALLLRRQAVARPFRVRSVVEAHIVAVMAEHKIAQRCARSGTAVSDDFVAQPRSTLVKSDTRVCATQASESSVSRFDTDGTASLTNRDFGPRRARDRLGPNCAAGAQCTQFITSVDDRRNGRSLNR